MGNIPNTNPKYKPKKLTKMQVEIACIKVRVHLELVKDRKVNELMKDEKVLVGMLNAKSRNKIEETLQAEKVISDLKYIQACTTLMAYANTLKNNCAVIAESQGNPLSLSELIPYILSIIYASTHLGLTSLNEFKMLMMNYFGTENVELPMNQIDPKIIEAFKVNSTPYELNTYFIEMAERNNIPLETVNVVGHNVTRHYTGPTQNVPQTNPYQNNQQNQNQFQPQQQQPQAQPNVYQGNPYRNSVNFEAPQFNPNQNNQNNQNQNNFNNNNGYNPNTQNNQFNNANNNTNNHGINPQAQNNFNYPTQQFNPFNNNAYQFDTKPINVPTYIPTDHNISPEINHRLAPNIKSIAPVVPPNQFEADPYANLLNINQINDIPLYPQMDRLSLNPNKNKPADTNINNYNNFNDVFKNDTQPTKPFEYGDNDIINLNDTKKGGANINYSPDYVPFNADYQPPKAVESNIYPSADFKDYTPYKPTNQLDNFNLDNQGYNNNNNNFAKPQIETNPNVNYNQGFNPYGNMNDPGFDQICDEIRKGL